MADFGVGTDGWFAEFEKIGCLPVVMWVREDGNYDGVIVDGENGIYEVAEYSQFDKFLRYTRTQYPPIQEEIEKFMRIYCVRDPQNTDLFAPSVKIKESFVEWSLRENTNLSYPQLKKYIDANFEHTRRRYGGYKNPRNGWNGISVK